MTIAMKDSLLSSLRWGCSAATIGCLVLLNPNLAQAGTALVSNPSNDSTATGTINFEPPTAGTSFDGVTGATTTETTEGTTVTTTPESSTQSGTAQVDFNGAEEISLVIVNNDNTSYSAADATVTVSPTSRATGTSGASAAIAQLPAGSAGQLSQAGITPGQLGSGGVVITTSPAVTDAIQTSITTASLSTAGLTGTTATAVSNLISAASLPAGDLANSVVATALNDALAAVAAYITSQGGPANVSPEVQAVANTLTQIKRATFPALAVPESESE